MPLLQHDAATDAIDATLTVNAVLRRWPAAVAPLAEYGVDACCGGAATLAEAAADAGVPLADLVAAIARVAGGRA